MIRRLLDRVSLYIAQSRKPQFLVAVEYKGYTQTTRVVYAVRRWKDYWVFSLVWHDGHEFSERFWCHNFDAWRQIKKHARGMAEGRPLVQAYASDDSLNQLWPDLPEMPQTQNRHQLSVYVF
jgi:hypothetical protein